MNTENGTHSIHQDPLGLRDLSPVTPDEDGWPAIRQALEEHHARKGRRRTALGWLAAAASVVLAVVLATQQMSPVKNDSPPAATQGTELASTDNAQTVDSLISLSQTLESQLRTLRAGTVAMPGSSAVYVAELEDLVAQVDDELSYSPDSINLWGQRVNLLLDLAQIYQHQWETDYGKMASL